MELSFLVYGYGFGEWRWKVDDAYMRWEFAYKRFLKKCEEGRKEMW